MNTNKSSKLNQFTNGQILQSIGHVRLGMLLDSFKPDLLRANVRTLPPSLDPASTEPSGHYFEAIATALRDSHLPEPLLSTLLTLERAAAPDSAAALDDAIQRRLPCISLKRDCPLDCALELFFTCPDELARFIPDTESSSTENQNPKFDNQRPHNGGQESSNGHQLLSPIEIRPHNAERSSLDGHLTSGGLGKPNSKIENPPGSSLQLPPGWVMQVDPWPEPVNGALLLDNLRHLFSQSVVLPKWVPELLPLFVLHTYAYQLRDVSVYLGVVSPIRRCGKTTLLSLLLRLVSRPVVSSNVSSSSFFHVIEELKPTLMIDEADRFLKSREDLQGILNAGYTPDTAYVIRMGPPAPGSKAQSAVNFFSVWCPKVIAQIGPLPDTLADRCIVFRMQRKVPTEECQPIRNLNTLDLRRQCARFVRDHAQHITGARPESPRALNDRAADIWEPLLVLADLAGGNWPALVRDAAVGLAASSEENHPISSLLLDIFVLFTQKAVDRLFTRELIDGLTSRFLDRPWMDGRNGKPITDIWLSQQLRPYGIRPKSLWINGIHAKGYFLDDLKEVCRRYVTKTDFDQLLTQINPPRPDVPGPVTKDHEILSP